MILACTLLLLTGFAEVEVIQVENPNTSEVSAAEVSSVAPQPKPVPAPIIRVLNHVEQIEQQLSELIGKIELLEHTIEGLERKLTKKEEVVPPVIPEATAPEPAEKISPEQIYEKARALIVQADYGAAEKALTQFIADHSEHKLATSALYWLGETYFVRQKYAESAKKFLEGYQKDPKGSKAPDFLLKLGMSLANLEKKKEACATFKKLLTEFPKSSTKSAATREMKRVKCQK